MPNVVAFEISDAQVNKKLELAQLMRGFISKDSLNSEDLATIANATIELLKLLHPSEMEELDDTFNKDNLSSIPTNLENSFSKTPYYTLLKAISNSANHEELKQSLELAASYPLEEMMYHAVEDWQRMNRQVGSANIQHPPYDETIKPLKTNLGKKDNFKAIETLFNNLATQIAQSIPCTADQAKALIITYNQSGPLAKVQDVNGVLQQIATQAQTISPLPTDPIIVNGNLMFAYTQDCSRDNLKAEYKLALQVPANYKFNPENYMQGLHSPIRMVVADPALSKEELQTKLNKAIAEFAQFSPSAKEDFQPAAPSAQEILSFATKPRFFDYQYYVAKKHLGMELSWVEKVVDRVLNVLGKAPAITIVNQPEMKTPETDRVRTPKEIQQARALSAEVESHSTTAVVDPTTPRKDSPGKEIGIGK